MIHTPRIARGVWGGVGLVMLLLASVAATAAPYRPQQDSDILERLPAQLANPAALRGRELSPDLAARLARAYIARGRASGDPREFGYAQGALQPWWNAEDAPDPVLLLRSTLRQSRHDFAGALADLDRLLQRKPSDAQAWLTKATVLRVQGRYAEARTACSELQQHADAFIATLCEASVRGLNGELAVATKVLDALRPQLPAQPVSIAAWFLAERAEQAVRAGDAAAAQAIYTEALASHADDLDLRASYADLLLDAGRPAEVLKLIDANTPVDALRLRRALALRALKDPAFAAVDALIRDGFDSARRRGEALHLREEARYVLSQGSELDRALELADANWKVQHEPWDARLLIEAGEAARKPAAASKVREWIAATGFEDARLLRAHTP